jgi:hypothetical protein
MDKHHSPMITWCLLYKCIQNGIKPYERTISLPAQRNMPHCKIHKQDKRGYCTVNQHTNFKTQALGNMRTTFKWSMKNIKIKVTLSQNVKRWWHMLLCNMWLLSDCPKAGWTWSISQAMTSCLPLTLLQERTFSRLKECCLSSAPSFLFLSFVHSCLSMKSTVN